MAVESPKVTAATISAGESPDLVRQFRVSGVPKTVVNGTSEILGARPQETFVRMVTSGQSG